MAEALAVAQRHSAGGSMVALLAAVVAAFAGHTGAFGPLRLQVAMSYMILSCVATLPQPPQHSTCSFCNGDHGEFACPHTR